jgi:hypothetical protein
MNDFTLFSNKIEDNKQEKIAFVIDTSDEIFKEDFKTINNERIHRLEMIFEEIVTFVKLKDYISIKSPEFALYTYSDCLKKEIDFMKISEFISNLNQVKYNLKTYIYFGKSIVDLSHIFSEAFNSMQKFDKEKDKNIPSLNEIIVRYILIYNRSDISAINSNEEQYNITSFIRLTNFFFDVIFLRRRITTEEDKIIQNEVFSSLTSFRPKTWYAFEISGNVSKFKFSMNLILANPNQRIKFNELDKNQKAIEDIVKNYMES